MATTDIRLLTPADADTLFALRRQALTADPLAFAASPEDDLAASPDTVRAMLGGDDPAVIYGAFDGDALCGMLGLYRDRKRKLAHKIHLWGMYVAPAGRGRGLAAGLLAAALRHAATLDGVTRVQISVSDTADAARALYERTGFRVWGTEPDALCHEGRAVAEHHMTMDLLAQRP